jgi:hypothetical protein
VLWKRREILVRIATRYGMDGPGSNPCVGEIFSTRPDRPWDPPSLLYNGNRVSFPGVKRPGLGEDHPPSSTSGVRERVELYLYSPSGPSWPVLGRTLPFVCDYIGSSEYHGFEICLRRIKKRINALRFVRYVGISILDIVKIPFFWDKTL